MSLSWGIWKTYLNCAMLTWSMFWTEALQPPRFSQLWFFQYNAMADETGFTVLILQIQKKKVSTWNTRKLIKYESQILLTSSEVWAEFWPPTCVMLSFIFPAFSLLKNSFWNQTFGIESDHNLALSLTNRPGICHKSHKPGSCKIFLGSGKYFKI